MSSKKHKTCFFFIKYLFYNVEFLCLFLLIYVNVIVSSNVLWSLTMVVLLGRLTESRPGSFLDDTDLCIMNCDRCYKNEIMLDCANTCLATAGKMTLKWKQQCLHFNMDLPTVIQI